VAPWTIRNVAVLRAPVPLTTSMGPALLSGDNASVWSDPERRGGTLDVLRAEPYAGRLRSLDEPARDTRARDLALGFIAHQPPRAWAAVAGARLARLWDPAPHADDPADDAARGPGPATRVLAVAEVMWLALAAWGALRTVTGPRRWFQSLPLAALLALVAAALLVSGSTRARLGFEPLVALLAGVGALHARRSLHLRRRGLRVVSGAGQRPP